MSTSLATFQLKEGVLYSPRLGAPYSDDITVFEPAGTVQVSFHKHKWSLISQKPYGVIMLNNTVYSDGDKCCCIKLFHPEDILPYDDVSSYTPTDWVVFFTASVSTKDQAHQLYTDLKKQFPLLNPRPKIYFMQCHENKQG